VKHRASRFQELSQRVARLHRTYFRKVPKTFFTSVQCGLGDRAGESATNFVGPSCRQIAMRRATAREGASRAVIVPGSSLRKPCREWSLLEEPCQPRQPSASSSPYSAGQRQRGRGDAEERHFRSSRGGRLCPWQASEDRRIMATCCEQHKRMPDRVVKAQALPGMKERAERVENAPDREKP
jgi:hypothetical protein